MSEETAENKKAETNRPLDPKTGALIMLGSLAVAGLATWGLSTLFPFGPETLDKLWFPIASQGAWLIIGAWLLFPVVFAAAFLLLAKGVDPMRQALAYAGVTYFLQCWAELEARGNTAMWPELFFTAAPTIILYFYARKNAPDGDDSQPSS